LDDVVVNYEGHKSLASVKVGRPQRYYSSPIWLCLAQSWQKLVTLVMSTFRLLQASKKDAGWSPFWLQTAQEDTSKEENFGV